MKIRMTVGRLIRAHRKHNPNSTYFTRESMRAARESRHTMRVMPGMAMRDGHWCVVLRSIQKRDGIALTALAYFDADNYELVAGCR